MKKNLRIMMAALAATAAITSCQQDDLVPDTLDNEGKTLVVNASLSDETKTLFDDFNGLTWNQGDALDVVGAKEYVNQAISFSENNPTEASLTLADAPSDGKIWLLYNNDNRQVDKLEFKKFYSNITQAEAGTINSDIIQLKSDAIELSEETEAVSTKMNIVGTIARFLVFSKTGEYSDEKVESVCLSTNEDIAGSAGALIGYNLTKGKYIMNPAAETNDECTVYYYQNSKDITTTLTEPYSLDRVTEPMQGSGIYMAVPPVSIEGYKYVVTTDKATYTFDASDKSCTFAENTIKNVLLNLENGYRWGHNELSLEWGNVEFNTSDKWQDNDTLPFDKTGTLWFNVNTDASVEWTYKVWVNDETHPESALIHEGTRSGVNTFTIEVTKNNSTIERTWTIEVTTENENVLKQPLTFTLHQGATKNPIYDFRVDKYEFDGASGTISDGDTIEADVNKNLWPNLTADSRVFPLKCNVYIDNESHHTIDLPTQTAAFPVFISANTTSVDRTWRIDITTESEYVENQTISITFTQKGVTE